MFAIVKTCIMLLALALPVQDKGKGQLRFDEQKFDFGKIEETAGPVSHTFLYANASDSDAFIASVSPSCSCTTAYYEHNVLHPGEYGEITVTFDPAQLPGQFRQNVLVLTSDKHTVRLYIEGVVKERDRGLDEKYPYFITSGLQADVLAVRFGFVPQGSSAEYRVGLANSSSAPIRLGYKLEKQDADLKVSCPEVIKPGQTAEMVIAFKLRKGRLGSLDNAVSIVADGQSAYKPVSVFGSAVYSTEVRPDSPSFRFEPTLLSFDRKKKNMTLTFTNDGKSELKIMKVECPAELQGTVPEGTVIPAGKSLEFKVRRPSADCRIRVFSNDPARPMRDIIIKTTDK